MIALIIGKTYVERGDSYVLPDDEALVLIRDLLLQYHPWVVARNKNKQSALFIDQANYLSEKALGTICYVWEVACVPVVLAGTKSFYELFTSSRLTEDVRSQLSSRIEMHYPLSGLSLGEAKALIQRELGKYGNDDEDIAQIYNIAGGLMRQTSTLIKNLLELIALNREELESGKVALKELIAKAGSKLLSS
jgi:hypothetical protein